MPCDSAQPEQCHFTHSPLIRKATAPPDRLFNGWTNNCTVCIGDGTKNYRKYGTVVACTHRHCRRRLQPTTPPKQNVNKQKAHISSLLLSTGERCSSTEDRLKVQICFYKWPTIFPQIHNICLQIDAVDNRLWRSCAFSSVFLLPIGRYMTGNDATYATFMMNRWHLSSMFD